MGDPRGAEGDLPVTRLFHIAVRSDWDEARLAGLYRVSTLGKSLEDEGFIHMSYPHQVKLVADAAYHGREDLVLLEIDPSRLGSSIVVEAVRGGEMEFPHLYGPLEVDAVVAVHEMSPSPDGTFDPVS